MKNNIVLFVLVCIPVSAEYKPFGVAGMQEFHKGNERNLQIIATLMGAGAAKVGSVAYMAGYNSAYGALVGASAAAKAGAIVAAPWVAGGAVVGYGSYKTYRYFFPYLLTREEQIEISKRAFRNCLNANKNGTFNSHEFPSECTEVALSFALVEGVPQTQGMIDAFKDFKTD